MSVEQLDIHQDIVTLRYRLPMYLASEWFGKQTDVTRRVLPREISFWVPRHLMNEDRTRIRYNGHCIGKLMKHHDACMDIYKYMISFGVREDQAWACLPQSVIIECIEESALASIVSTCNKVSPQPEMNEFTTEILRRISSSV
jgi:hypothetical protein